MATQNIIAVLIVIGCFSLAIISALKGISPESQGFISQIVSPAIVGVIGWLYTMSKNGDKPKTS